MRLVPICPLADLGDPDSRAFTVGEGDWPLRGFLVRTGDSLRAYVNRCPHAGHPLNMRPHEFLTPDKELIMCRSHMAMFDPRTGVCVAGPCTGASLSALEVTVDAAGRVLLALND